MSLEKRSKHIRIPPHPHEGLDQEREKLEEALNNPHVQEALGLLTVLTQGLAREAAKRAGQIRRELAARLRSRRQ